MKKTLAIFLTIVIISFTIFGVSRSGVLIRQFKNPVEKTLSELLNREIKIGHLEGGIF